MSKNRSRRLRKKMHLDEFQEIGFIVQWQFDKKTTSDKVDSIVKAFIEEIIEPNQLVFEGGGHLSWEGLVYLQKRGKCTDEHREKVHDWLKANSAKKIQVSPLFDIWWELIDVDMAYIE